MALSYIGAGAALALVLTISMVASETLAPGDQITIRHTVGLRELKGVEDDKIGRENEKYKGKARIFKESSPSPSSPPAASPEAEPSEPGVLDDRAFYHAMALELQNLPMSNRIFSREDIS